MLHLQLERANNAITLKTIYKYNKRFLFLVSEYITAFMDNLRLSGTVELDETLVTKRKYNKGRMPKWQIWLFGFYQR